MRPAAIVLAYTLIAGPPAKNIDHDCGDNDCEPEPECSIDSMLEGDCEPNPSSEQDTVRGEETGPEQASPEDLKIEARGLAARGDLKAAITVYERAYQLAPGDHILAYEIGAAAWRLHDCGKSTEYLTHFLKYADSSTFPNKVSKAAMLLTEIQSECSTSVD